MEDKKLKTKIAIILAVLVVVIGVIVTIVIVKNNKKDIENDVNEEKIYNINGALIKESVDSNPSDVQEIQ